MEKTKGTPLSQELLNYINDLFPSEDEFLKELNKEARSQHHWPPIQITEEQVSFLQFFLRAISAKNVLEIGALAGYSAISMARALPDDGKLWTIEPVRNRCEFINKKLLEIHMQDKITVLHGKAGKILVEYTFPVEFDFIFIDADKMNYKNYLDLCTPILKKGGVICADNALAWGQVAEKEISDPDVIGVQMFNKAISEDKRYKSALIPLGDGMLFGVKESN